MRRDLLHQCTGVLLIKRILSIVIWRQPRTPMGGLAGHEPKFHTYCSQYLQDPWLIMIVMLEYSVWPRNCEGVPGYPTFTDCRITFESYRLPDDMSGACGINFDQQMWLTRSCHISAKMDRWRSAPQAWPILLHALFCWMCGQETSVPSKPHPLFLAPHNVAIWCYMYHNI